MRNDREKAYELRQQGKSYREIRDQLNIPLGTLSGWFKNQEWSETIKNELTQKASFSSPEKLKRMMEGNKKRWNLLHEKYRREAIKEFAKLKKDPLFLAGVMLYWGEGERNPKSSMVSLANSDPALMKLFYLFLKNSISISEDNIHSRLLLYPDLVDSVQKNFWGSYIGISSGQFKRSTYIKSKHSARRLSYGVCTISVQSRALKERMLKWIELSDSYLKSLS